MGVYFMDLYATVWVKFKLIFLFKFLLNLTICGNDQSPDCRISTIPFGLSGRAGAHDPLY